ncbi:unnamed protein product, partial [Rotaria socialis]
MRFDTFSDELKNADILGFMSKPMPPCPSEVAEEYSNRQ